MFYQEVRQNFTTRENGQKRVRAKKLILTKIAISRIVCFNQRWLKRALFLVSTTVLYRQSFFAHRIISFGASVWSYDTNLCGWMKQFSGWIVPDAYNMRQVNFSFLV